MVPMFSKGENRKMGRIQSKLLFALVLYGAGFATAMYLVAPVEESETGQKQAASMTTQSLSRQQIREHLLAASCKLRLGMNKLVSFAEEQSGRVAEYVRQKWNEPQPDAG